MGFPLMVRAIRLSIEAVDRQLEEAAKTLGAGPVSVFLVITLPLSVPGIASMILCFARSMGEFGVTITFVSNIPGETQTLPSAIFTLTQVPGGHAGPAHDSPLEGDGFEFPVPRQRRHPSPTAG
jgi:molybdate transport system permease protein